MNLNDIGGYDIFDRLDSNFKIDNLIEQGNINRNDDDTEYPELLNIEEKKGELIKSETELKGIDIDFNETMDHFFHLIEMKEILKIKGKCINCNKKNPSFVCKCLKTAYCDKECQLQDRKRHKNICDSRLN
eukprot:TRINITY_DN3420_c0_g1_i2.p1 TRINITY_DN3420_c0_g1~~TRINITY_DN3420_c0_g1_i2.p1  ORF type:complete len:131 (-),score=0.45 TRINITY_DN3420_c0_g1_i2:193-585(-)